MVLRPFWNSWSITKLVLLMVLAPLIFVSVILSYYQIDGRLSEMVDKLRVEGRIIANHVSDTSEHYMFTGNDEKLQNIIDKVVRRKNVEHVEILDQERNVIVSAGSLQKVEKDNRELLISSPIIYKDTIADEMDQEMLPLDVTVGWVQMEMSPAVVEKNKRSILINSLLILISGLFISVALAYLFSRSLLIPIKKLHTAVESMREGNFDNKLSIQQGGEFGELEDGINHMADELQLSNQYQQKKIDDATQSLMELVLQLEQKNVLLDEARKEAEEIGNSKVEFLANMSHEIRTPLNAVIGASDILMKIVHDDSVSKYMSTLSIASRQLNGVVDDILDFSRMEANKLELEHVSFSIVDALENIISLHSPIAQEKGLVLELKLASDLPNSIFGDSLRISQIISNLVSNAIKFTEHGSVVLSADAVVINNQSIRLQLNVIDTGAGLTADAQERLFDAFSQADSAVARKYGGSGLGLAIVRKLIEQMNGFINVKSNVGEGTEFNVYLDLMLDKRKVDSTPVQQPGAVVNTSSLKNMNILIAEDNSFNRQLLTDMLEANGANVVAVDDGQYAVEAVQEKFFDIVFLDLHMPRKDGITAAKEIKLITAQKSPFLIAATADVFIKDQGEDVEVFDSFIFKPIREEVLLEKVMTLLNFQGEFKTANVIDDDADSVFSEKLDREVRKLVLHIVEGSNNDNYAEIKNYAHQLRGVCGFYEMSEMTIVAAGLEKAAVDKKRGDVVILIKVLLKQLNISPDYKKIH